MAETAITAVLSKFGELASREAAVLVQVGNDIMLLRDRLEWLQAFIRDGDRKRRLASDDFTRVWVRQTRDVAFEAEDALDDFFHKVDLEAQGYRGWRIWRRYITGCGTQISVRHDLSGQIKRIKSRLDQISENHKEFKIEHTPGAWTSSITEVAAWDNTGGNPVGFDAYVTVLKTNLLSHEHTPQQRFISILGESGIGKNTLMIEIWREINDRHKDHFDVLIWYNMPPNSSANDLLKQVYERALAALSKVPEGEDNDITKKLRSFLHDKRYLVILGGINSIRVLNCVKASLPDNRNGSRVVLILEPESQEVARHAQTLDTKVGEDLKNISGSTVQIGRLNESQSAELFCRRVYGERYTKPKGYKLSYNEQIFMITGGHPLAIVVLAGLLRSKEMPVEWDSVLQQLMPGVEAVESQGNKISGVLLTKEKPFEWDALLQQMMPTTEAKLSNRMTIERIFSTSFDDLPHDLKSCFLYFAAYPTNITHPADQIMRMWIAEGFIKPEKGKSMEDLGQAYLKELVSRCLVEVKTWNECDRIALVQVHNRLLRFLQSEAREASFIEIHDNTDVLAPAAVRRLSIQNDSGNYIPFGNKFLKLRSFICRVEEGDGPCATLDLKNDSKKIPNKEPLKFLYGSKFLRVISIGGIRLSELPNEIGDMIHLRYLGVTCHDLQNLPSSIGRLLNLQTLDIRNSKVKSIAPKFWRIKTLRHVIANQLQLPNSVGDLNNLQTLHGVKPAENWGGLMCPLDMMTNLRSLELHEFNDANHGVALERSLQKLELLGHLKLTGDKIPLAVFTAPSLRCLESLVLEGSVKWPESSSNLCNQTQEDSLGICELRPNLVMLKLNSLSKKLEDFIEKLIPQLAAHEWPRQTDV
ncbi:putative disease resistance RPP13-like protein 2 [Oryza brachyantha]|uniref:NB-ARC domain-containing protein n=1 Tax=Oryza brachyantha TaxID=4533 RepID=J3N7F9_ORYBR|nr:putative disease resistance RPP13-like protein 2 [Oryza brachyantha]